MFRCSCSLILFSFFSFATLAAEQPLTKWSLAVDFTSWQEQLSITNGVVGDWGYANFTGDFLKLERERVFTEHHSSLAELNIGYGQTTATGAGGNLSYNVNNIGWTGAAASYRYLYNWTDRVGISIGPILLARQINLPSGATNINANSGYGLNYGALFDFRGRLFDHIILAQSLGYLTVRASTFWSLGIVYGF